MTRSPVKITAALVGCLTLSACGGGGASSGINPLNWFKKADTAETTTVAATPRRQNSLTPKRGYVNYVDPRDLIGEVLSVSIDRTPDGAIVRATGRTSKTGYYDIDLVRTAAGDNVFIYEFRVRSDEDTTVAGHVVNAATELTVAEYAWARRVIIRGANGSLTANR